MHDFDRLHDVETAPVAASESIGFGDCPNKILERDVSIFEAGFIRAHPLSRIAAVAEHLHVNSLDDGLGAGLSRTDAGLTTSPWIHSATRGDLLKSHHTRTTLAGAALAETVAVQLARAVEAVAHEQSATVVAVGGWSGGD